MRRSKAIFDRWGGGTAAFFAYTHMSHDSVNGLLQALLPLIRAGLGLNYLQSGLLLSAYSVTSGVSQIPWGWVGDRLSREKVIAVGLAGVGLTGLAVGLTSTYYPMLAVLVAMGIFAGAYHPSAMSMLSGYFGETRKGRAIALHMVGGNIGFTIGPLIGGLVAALLGWRWSYIFLSLPVILAAPIVLKRFSRQEEPGRGMTRISRVHAGTDGKAKNGQARLLQVLRPIALVSILVVISQFISGTALAFLPIYIVDKHGVDPNSSVLLIGMVRGAGIPGALFGGWLSDRWDRKNAIYLVLVVYGIVLYLLTVLPFNAGLVLVLIAFGVLTTMRQSTFQPFLMGNTPPHLSATVFGIYFGLGMEGVSLIQPVAGQFMDVFGIDTVFDVIALTGAALSVLTLIMAKSPRLLGKPGSGTRGDVP